MTNTIYRQHRPREKPTTNTSATGCQRKYTDKQNNIQYIIIKLVYDQDRHTVVE